jgi:hypothetical protein
LNPPNDNVSAPVNVSANPQIKNGFLGLYGGAAGLAVSKNELSYTLKNGLSLGVKGKIGADFFCNADGTKCADIDQLLGNSSTVINTTNTTNGCKYEQTTVNLNVALNAARNDVLIERTMANLIPGTWTVSGSGRSVKCSDSACGNHNIYIRISNKGAFGAGSKTLMFKGSKAKVHNWTVPETTFTVTQDETLQARVGQANMTGSLTLTGPKLVCPTN